MADFERGGGRACGIMLSEIPFSNFPLLFKRGGYDFFIIDCEHGGFDYADLSRILMMARLAGVRAIVRLPDNQRKDVTKFMDMGADGLLLPMTNCREDIARVVSFAKYAPLGRRGISTMRAHTLYDPPALTAYMEEANARTAVYAQIETVRGLENAEDILRTEGVAGCFFGPNDFSCDRGILGGGKEILKEAISSLAELCSKTERTAGIITSDKQLIAHAKGAGMTHFCVGSELSLFVRAAAQTVGEILQ